MNYLINLTDVQINRFKFDEFKFDEFQLMDAVEFIKKSGNENYFRRKGWYFTDMVKYQLIIEFANYLYVKNNYKDYDN